MRVSVCVGNYARSPYRVPGLEINVFSMEELCYCIRENAFLLDLSFMDDRLLEWIARECGMRELADTLHSLVHKKGSLSVFAITILRYVGFFDEDTIRETEKVLKQGVGLSGVEKRKNQIDYLVKNKRYRSALRGYDELLRIVNGNGSGDGTGEGSESDFTVKKEFLAKIWHNKGVAYVGLMLYESAAECFRQAFELDGDEAYCMDYLSAKRMQLSGKEYVNFTAEHGEWYRLVMDLEKRVEAASGEWEQQPDYLRLYNRREMRNHDKQKYYEDNDRLIQALKSSYRM